MVATTAGIVAVFVPVAFMPGIVGQFFREFGLTVCDRGAVLAAGGAPADAADGRLPAQGAAASEQGDAALMRWLPAAASTRRCAIAGDARWSRPCCSSRLAGARAAASRRPSSRPADLGRSRPDARAAARRDACRTPSRGRAGAPACCKAIPSSSTSTPPIGGVARHRRSVRSTGVGESRKAT